MRRGRLQRAWMPPGEAIILTARLEVSILTTKIRIVF
jgi:hypothetical protein